MEVDISRKKLSLETSYKQQFRGRELDNLEFRVTLLKISWIAVISCHYISNFSWQGTQKCATFFEIVERSRSLSKKFCWPPLVNRLIQFSFIDLLIAWPVDFNDGEMTWHTHSFKRMLFNNVNFAYLKLQQIINFRNKLIPLITCKVDLHKAYRQDELYCLPILITFWLGKNENTIFISVIKLLNKCQISPMFQIFHKIHVLLFFLPEFRVFWKIIDTF